MSLPAGHEQVEQDRALNVLPHHTELARPSAREPRGEHQPHRENQVDRGLKVHAELETTSYPTGVKVSNEELAAVRLRPDDFHGDWNECIFRTRQKK
jgi:hypothetical protein